jgi:hypothetical protein
MIRFVGEKSKKVTPMKILKFTLLIIGTLLYGCTAEESTGTNPSEGDESRSQSSSISIQHLETQQVTNIDGVIALFQKGNVDEIAQIIEYPLNRLSPIPSINDEKELKERFDEVFDETLINKIAGSSPARWREIGSKGVMFENGLVWLNNSGTKIISINYQTETERQMKLELMKEGQEQ